MHRERALAKVNYDLHILGKRADGYHLLDSRVVFAELADDLAFHRADALTLEVGGEFAALSGAPEENLVLRAACALNTHAGTAHGARIVLQKNIPVGAGLGGGSADAAATLRGLNALWGLGLSMDTLQRIAITLGADVPMCLHSVPLRAGGIGDAIVLSDEAPRGQWMVLVYPRVKLETARVFAALPHDSGGDASHGAENDLQQAAIALCPVIQDVLDALSVHGSQPPRMSGSGTCCFQLFTQETEAQACAAQITAQHPQWWVHATRVTL